MADIKDDLIIAATFDAGDYKDWIALNKDELRQHFARECDIGEEEVEDWYGPEFDKYCFNWYMEEYGGDNEIKNS